jgi:hypothetical protein
VLERQLLIRAVQIAILDAQQTRYPFLGTRVSPKRCPAALGAIGKGVGQVLSQLRIGLRCLDLAQIEDSGVTIPRLREERRSLIGIAPRPAGPATAADPTSPLVTLDPCREGIRAAPQPVTPADRSRYRVRFLGLGRGSFRKLPSEPFLNCQVPLEFTPRREPSEPFSAKRAYALPDGETDRIALWDQTCSSLHGQATNWCAYRFDLHGQHGSCAHGSCRCQAGQRDPAFSPVTDTDLPGRSESKALAPAAGATPPGGKRGSGAADPANR